MTKRREIEQAIEMFDSHIKYNTCLDCPKILNLLKEYQATLPPDREPWEVAYRKLYNMHDTIPMDGFKSNNFRDGYLARDAEKQEGSK